MLSSRVAAKQVLKAARAKTPQLTLPACSLAARYYQTKQYKMSKGSARGFATHVEEYEIDYISLKKKSKKKNASKKLDVELPHFGIKRPDNLGYPFHEVQNYNEALMEELLEDQTWGFRIVDEDGLPQGLAYTKHYCNELKVFEHFLQDTFNYQIKSFADLSGSEVVNTLFIFKDYYSRGDIPEVNKENKHKYDEMVRFFIEFVNKDARFPQEVVGDYFPRAKRSHEIEDFLNLGLYFYVPELTSLDREFNFKKIRSKKDLIVQIDKTVKEFDHFLEGNVNYDESFFKVLIQVERYKALRDKLTESITSLKVVKRIIEDNDFGEAMQESMFEGLTLKHDRAAIYEKVAELGVLWSLLEFGNLIPATAKYSELAPRLYEIATTRGQPFEEQARHFLEALTTDQLRSGKLLSHLAQFDFGTSKYNFTGNLEEDWILNFLLEEEFALETGLTEDEFWTEWDNFHPSDWAASEAFGCIDGTSVKRLAQNPDVLVKYLELKGDSLAECLPEDSPLLQARKELSAAKQGVGVDFAFYADIKHLVGDLTERAPLSKTSLDRLVSAILDSARYFGNHLEVLDEVVEDYEAEQVTDRHTSTNYKQIPDWLRLERHVPEIEFVQTLVGDFQDKSKVMSAIEDVTERILEDETLYPEINHGSLLTLRAKLKEFSTNNTTDCLEILNTVLLSNDVFAQFEKRVKEKPAQETAPYVQIPDELELSDFAKELANLRNALGGATFKEHSGDRVLKALDYQIDNFFGEASGKDSFISKNSDAFRYIRLKRRLGRLFDMNGQNTEALDVLLNSQAVFDTFESQKMAHEEQVAEEGEDSPEYRQLPNDFFLEEYVVELRQLRDTLHVDKLADVYAAEVLAKVEELSKASYSTSGKRLIWHKLYRNLVLLFKHNHGATFVLDNVLTSAAELEKLSKSTRTRVSDPVSEQVEFLKKAEYEVLGAFLTASRLLYKSDVTQVSRGDFNALVDMYIATLDATSLGYLFKKDVLDSLKKYNAEIDHYPAFLVCLYGMSKNLDGEPISKERLQEFYADLARSVTGQSNAAKEEPSEVVTYSTETDEVKDREHPSESTPEIEYEYDMREYEPSESKPGACSDVEPQVPSDKQKYHDSEQFIADLDNQSENVSRNDAFEDAVRAAFASALQRDEVQEASAHTKSAKRHHHKHSRSSTTSGDTSAIDTIKLKEYLMRLNKDELSRQRQAEAYEWSKFKYDQSLASSSKSYLLLGLVGEEIPVSEKLLSDELSHQGGIFEILDKFSNDELALVNDRLQCLQNDSYKVVGYKQDGKRKFLILENEGDKEPRGASGKSSWGKRVTTGAAAAMLAYLALSFASEEPKKGSSEEGAPDPSEVVGGSTASPPTAKESEPSVGESAAFPTSETPVSIRQPDLASQNGHTGNKERLGLKNILWSAK
ncbi:hypothetical protein CANMA_005359 [Candida margitis]|uniref:uncharacterized protein n=1 Tax=Candida margitis TaxID=1775924 RepID=UPI002227C259|nr:uncharacterized protein CANMA_005359 [Candida margitis]KAI5950430.1 hypothetical protein CANMA_005359 [Candida margitis]